MMTLQAGDTVVLLGCSNGRPRTQETLQEIATLVEWLEQYQLQVIIADTVFVDESTQETLPPDKRAATLLRFLLDEQVRAIFDVTGGDLANETLLALQANIATLKQVPTTKYYVGYSDNTVILNALMSYDLIYPINFLITQVLRDQSQVASQSFVNYFFKGQTNFAPQQHYGGNLRCFLKLAGTPYFPQQPIHSLLIEGLGGDINKVRTYLAQLALIGVFDSLEQLIVGQFSEIHQKGQQHLLEITLKSYEQAYGFKIVHTETVGHHHAVEPFPYKLA